VVGRINVRVLPRERHLRPKLARHDGCQVRESQLCNSACPKRHSRRNKWRSLLRKIQQNRRVKHKHSNELGDQMHSLEKHSKEFAAQLVRHAHDEKNGLPELAADK